MSYVFQPDPIYPRVPATLDVKLLTSLYLEEEKEEDLNPAPNYQQMNAEYIEKKEEDQQVTVLPLEQQQNDSAEEEPEFHWKDPYYIGKKCAYKRIVQVKDKKKNIPAKIYYRKCRLKDVKFPENKNNKKKSWEFDTACWNFESPDNNKDNWKQFPESMDIDKSL